jgi:subtilase-type serine protease
MTKKTEKARTRAYKFAASMLALSAGAGLASEANAQSVDGVWDESQIVVNNNMTANGNPPTGALDNTQNLTGIGQMSVRANPATTGRTVCSGTLINPRTVLFAAHCVNSRPMSAYGVNGTAFGPWTTGTPMSFGFEFDNLPAVRLWLGLASTVGGTDANPALLHTTNAARHLYAVENVWYDPRSLGPNSAGFLEGDVAIATLDTPAWDVPAWVMLFTPLQDSTHGVITGYGGSGTSASVNAGPLPSGNAVIDNRRRAAENMIDFLGSLNDRNDWLFGPPTGLNPQTLYQLDFDSPGGENTYTGTNPNYDFDLFNGTMLPREGTTAGGDSGGPLIADQYFDDASVVVGTLSGGSRFHTNQRFSTYGTNSFYQPLFLFWDQVVANNPYVYAGNFAGNASWNDASHWIQLMDPAYGIEVDGELVNALPGTAAGGVTGATYRFGEVCFQTDCTDNALDPEFTPWAVGTPNTIYIPGGPGSVNFVPNNVVANPSLNIRPRYYDVTLAAAGTTWLSSAVTIDRFTMANGQTTLDVQSGGTLSILGDATIVGGLLNVNGNFNSGEMVVVQGIITGTGTINPTFMTNVAGAIAPNGADVGTLTVRGDVILGSASHLFVEVGRDGADQLRILADPSQGTTGNIALGGDLRMVKAANGPAPRHGQVFNLILADGSVIDTFDAVYAQTGVLRPELAYLPNAVQITLRAGRFADVMEGNVHELAFAHALDDLRDGSYNLLYDLYGELDVMDFGYLNQAFSALAPVSLFDANDLLSMQDSSFAMTLQNRMALLSRSDPGALGLSIMGTPRDIFAFSGDEGMAAASDLAFASSISDSHQVMTLSNGLSAFFSGGYDDRNASPSSGQRGETDSMRTWEFAGGLEQTLGDLTIGFAAGYSRGEAQQSAYGSLAENDIAQSAVFGVYRFDGGGYVSGMVGAGSSSASLQRNFATGALDYHLQGQVEGDLYLGAIEAGYNVSIGSDFTLTPNVSMRRYTLRTAAYDEQGGEAALSLSAQTFERDEARVGLRFAGETTLNSGWRVTPTLDASLVANLTGDDNGVWTRFVNAPEVSFYLPGAVRDDYWGEMIGGLRLVRDETSFALSVETSVGREEDYSERFMARYATRF